MTRIRTQTCIHCVVNVDNSASVDNLELDYSLGNISNLVSKGSPLSVHNPGSICGLPSLRTPANACYPSSSQCRVVYVQGFPSLVRNHVLYQYALDQRGRPVDPFLAKLSRHLISMIWYMGNRMAILYCSGSTR